MAGPAQPRPTSRTCLVSAYDACAYCVRACFVSGCFPSASPARWAVRARTPPRCPHGACAYLLVMQASTDVHARTNTARAGVAEARTQQGGVVARPGHATLHLGLTSSRTEYFVPLQRVRRQQLKRNGTVVWSAQLRSCSAVRRQRSWSWPWSRECAAPARARAPVRDRVATRGDGQQAAGKQAGRQAHIRTCRCSPHGFCPPPSSSSSPDLGAAGASWGPESQFFHRGYE